MTHNPAEALREALLPCPFCGEAAQIERIGDRSKSTIYSCTYCMCRLETGEEWNHGAGWNKRAALTSPAPAGGEVLIKRIEDALVGPSVMEQFDDKLGITTGEREHIFRMAALLREAATLLESLSAEKGRLVEALEYIADFANVTAPSSWAVDVQAIIRRARTALTPKEKA